MHLRLLIYCFFACTLLSSCGFYETKERIALYKQISVTNDSLDRMTKEWHSTLDRAVRVKNFSALNPCRVKLARFISRKRQEIVSMEVPADAETLRQSEGVFLTAQTNMVTDIYPLFEPYSEMTPDATIQKTLKLVAKDLETEVAWNLTIKKSLEAFAIKNKIKGSKLK